MKRTVLRLLFVVALFGLGPTETRAAQIPEDCCDVWTRQWECDTWCGLYYYTTCDHWDCIVDDPENYPCVGSFNWYCNL